MMHRKYEKKAGDFSRYPEVADAAGSPTNWVFSACTPRLLSYGAGSRKVMGQYIALVRRCIGYLSRRKSQPAIISSAPFRGASLRLQ